jgi:wobble nucleotide-excising tRNase
MAEGKGRKTPAAGVVPLPRTTSSDLPGANRPATAFDVHTLDKRVNERISKVEESQIRIASKVDEIEKMTIQQSSQLDVLVGAEERREKKELAKLGANVRLSTEREKTYRLKTSTRAKVIIALFSFLSATAGAIGAYWATKG